MVVWHRKYVNILVTGTQGVGKSFFSENLEEITRLKWLNLNQIAIDSECVETYIDENSLTNVVNKEKLLGCLENVKFGGFIIDYYDCKILPTWWFDIVVVLTADVNLMRERLHEKGYRGDQLMRLLNCESSQTPLEEASFLYPKKIVYEIKHNSLNDLLEGRSNIAEVLLQLHK